ncbi:MAG: glutamate mutase L [candidate division Zixibacteria bacterium]|nr:glutamate mutase L [candidate division Zixibacteria bacterium]
MHENDTIDFQSLIREKKCFCVIDIGSTTTKVLLFRKEDDWRFYREEKPTTVEKPYEDVTIGVVNALRELEKRVGVTLLDGDTPAVPCLSTSSAGGGLAIVVAGLVGEVTTRSAERVALGAGCIIQGILALDDRRTPYKKVELLKTLRPDMLLLAGGFDGGAVNGPVFLAELFRQAGLRPKLTRQDRLPVIYAGNEGASDYVKEVLENEFVLYEVPNIRPSSKKENLEPARNAIHEVFMEHVMSRAPGYDTYREWVSATLLPTPAAVGKILALASKDMNARLLAVDIGGATTDVFTADRGRLFRTVSANLGMSYSILNVVDQAGLDTIHRLIDFDISHEELLDCIGNKYLQPTSLPFDRKGTVIECAVASAAIREAVKDHFRVLEGVALSRTEEELGWNILKHKGRGRSPKGRAFDLDGYDLVIGSGGRLSHSPREIATMILLNALEPTHRIDLAVDSVFMFPHLGVLSQVDEKLALDLFYRLGLVRLGTVIAPDKTARPGKKVMTVTGHTDRGRELKESLQYGDVRTVHLTPDESAELTITTRKLKCKYKHAAIPAGSHLILDARGRPAEHSANYGFAADYLPSVTRRHLESEPRVTTGDIIEPRELAVPGEVLVTQDERVTSDTIVARSHRSFLRPFFLHVTESLGIPAEDLRRVFTKSIGDTITAKEVIAQRTTRLLEVKRYRSPVNGVVERILPNGVVLVREKEEHVMELGSVDVAHILDVEPKNITAYIKCKEGDEVEKNQILAGHLTSRQGKVCRSPMRGTVKDINLEHGIIVIEPLLEELSLTAWLPGRVTRVTDRGCLIGNAGTIITGAWGSGGQLYGILHDTIPEQGAIMMLNTITRTDLASCRDAGVTGIIAGSMHLKDFQEIQPDCAIVLTEGFGARPMNSDVMSILAAYQEKAVALDASTQLRAGVVRPRIILPERQ